jgi:IS30 family transposase
MQISHETIYRTLYIQTRGALKKELLKHLRTRRVMRQSKGFDKNQGSRGKIVDPLVIHERPAEVEDRVVPGHWEGGLISGSGNTHIATLVERHSRYVLLVKLKGKDAKSVHKALVRKIKRLPAELKKSLTWDRGLELSNHKKFTIATGVQVFFCDPQSPWQRGSNENTNGLLRQYLPKKADLSVHSQQKLNRIAHELNTRPRKTLQYLTPAEKLQQVLR